MLLACTILNPILLRMGNFITSDALFTALSLVWFTQLLWLLYKPGARLLAVHAVVLLLAFMVRYNALYYPVISVLLILFARVRFRTKIGAIALIALLLGAFVGKTQYEYDRYTGTIQFSGFGGWQLAINALYAYAHEPLDSLNMVPVRFRGLHALVNGHMDSLSHLPVRPDASLGIYYLSSDKSPLNVYQHNDTSHPSVRSTTLRWLLMGPLYGQYGNWLIRHHRAAYNRYFLEPNMFNYLTPSPEFLSSYSVNTTLLDPVAVSWFGFEDKSLHTYPRDGRIMLINQLPKLFAMVNIIFVLALIGYAFTGGFSRRNGYAGRTVLLTGLFWFCNMVFSILASVIVLRYQVFPLILLYTFAGLLLGYIWQQATLKKTQPHDIPARAAPASI